MPIIAKAGLIALGMVASCVLWPGAAQGQVQLSAGQVFDAAQQLASDGDLDHAIEMLKVVTQDKNLDYRAEARVRIARYLNARGDKRGALYWYRQLLDEKPDASAVRVEVAMLLASLGEERAAANELRRAEAVGLPEEVSRAIHNAAELFWNNRPVGIDLSVGIAPDTNINSATSSDAITIFGLPFQLSEDGKAHSGVGLTFDGSLTVRRPMSGQGRLILQAGASGRLYRDNRFNDVAFSASAGPELAISRSVRLRPALLVGRRIYGVDKLYDFYGVSGVGLFSLGPRAQVTVNGTLTDFNYTPMRHSQSGPAYTAGLAYDRAFSGRLSARAGVAFGRMTALDPQFATKSLSGDLTVSRDLGHWALWARGAFTWLKSDADYAFFGAARNDRIAQADAGLIFRRLSILGLSPQIKATYIRAASPVSLFRYRRLRSEFSLEKSF